MDAPLVTAQEVLQLTELERLQREREALVQQPLYDDNDTEEPDVFIQQQRQAVRQSQVAALDERIRRAKLG